MPGDYHLLAPIYDAIGMSDFVQDLAPRILSFIRDAGWMGRRAAVLGCGTGAAIPFLTDMQTIIGVDSSAEMLELARQKLDDPELEIRWLKQDIRELSSPSVTDLVLAFNVLNELTSLRDFESVFAGVHKMLELGKWFIFDVHTVQGITEAGQVPQGMIFNDSTALTVFCTNDFDFERQTFNRTYLSFQRSQEDEPTWLRYEAKRSLRAFPIQAITALLQRTGFQVQYLLDLDLQPYEAGVSRAPRVVFIVERR